ncbi:MmcQ/YjbR family DNA-binding protein [Adhaeribacter swui]|uniref:MmcQ/YjbR family DNA-binding protein n=1 Tax=Adhaeribacter swui TaxID=2086471 RepID=A0A7G7GDJ0_9BACT|nr:MmcQ/YjbR family DNA-binding protein [Adhaeribacter swui]QNF35224.1 MmcQ/YjbR family DNA-binding protein [Adhaeribacter swui]
MNIEDFRDYCLAKPGVTEETPFGDNTLVFKVAGKIFALTDINEFASVNLKCDPDKAMELRELHDEVQPGYHMNKKHWNTVSTQGNISDNLLREWIDHSYELVFSKLTRVQKLDLE